MNKGIIESFEFFVKIMKTLEKLGGDCSIEEPATEEEITEYELKLGYTLPEDFKDWLRITKGISISAGTICINIYMPDNAEKHVDGFMALVFGNDCAFRTYCINLETGQSYIYDDDFGTEKYDSFEDLLDDIYYSDIEAHLDGNEETENWLSVYNEMFPEENE